MTSSLETFRAHYPEAGLTADLISVHDGQYVVRAVVIHKGEALATGLAASADIQIAEDRARDRAIALLALPSSHPTINGSTNSSTQPQPASAPIESEPDNGRQTATEKPVEESPVPFATPNPAPSESEEDAVTLEPPEAELDPTEDMGPPLDAIAEESAPPSAATIALENFSTSEIPVDLSDVIAQTDVELTRLGWTNVQGREYLQQTYGKRSRRELTDEELMSFLLYLEEQ